MCMSLLIIDLTHRVNMKPRQRLFLARDAQLFYQVFRKRADRSLQKECVSVRILPKRGAGKPECPLIILSIPSWISNELVHLAISFFFTGYNVGSSYIIKPTVEWIGPHFFLTTRMTSLPMVCQGCNSLDKKYASMRSVARLGSRQSQYLTHFHHWVGDN